MKLTSKLKIALKSLLSVSLAEVVTDKATLVYDGELAEGIEVFVKDEEAEDGVKPAEDGTYETETQIIEVAEGKITKITEKEKENETPAEDVTELSAKREQFNKVKAAFSETYSEKIRKIAEAVASEGYDAYVIDAADDFAIVEVWNEDSATWADFRFDVSWDEDGNAVISNGIEVEPKYVTKEEDEIIDEVREGNIELAEETPVPADEPEDNGEGTTSVEDRLDNVENLINEVRNALEQILNGIAGLDGRVEALEEKVNKLDETPADEPADDNSAEESEPVSKAYYLRKQK